jgi:hypothetical protein
MRNLTVKGIVTALRTALKISPILGRSRSRPEPPLQPTTRLAGQPRLRSTVSKPVSSHDARGVGERLGVGAEELRADGVLVVVEGEVALALGLAHAGEAVGGGELGHEQAAAGLLVGDLAFLQFTQFTLDSDGRQSDAS